MAELRVQDLGERGLLQRLMPHCPNNLVGDDGAVLPVAAGQRLVVTTDVLVDGVHFSDRTTPPSAVGWRAAAANLSDLAAMGATPLGLTVGLSLPPPTPVPWVEAVYAGMGACLVRYGGAIIGGDLCRAPVRSLAITALGQVDPAHALYRHCAQPGYCILVTGPHGLAQAGLTLLLNPDRQAELPAPLVDEWVQAHQRPQPRFDGMTALAAVAAERGADLTTIAAMDSSDGLANAVTLLCEASGVGAHLQAERLPLSPALSQWVGPEQAQQWCLYGGEDFELVLCVPPTWVEPLQQRLPAVQAIGTITAGSGIVLSTLGQPDRDLSTGQDFQHFSA